MHGLETMRRLNEEEALKMAKVAKIKDWAERQKVALRDFETYGHEESKESWLEAELEEMFRLIEEL